MKDLLKQLLELMPLAAAATNEPWGHCSSDDYNGWCLVREADMQRHRNGQPEDFASLSHYDDAAFIAAVRNLLTPENLTLLVTALAGPVANESVLETLVNEAVKAWALEDDEDDMSLPIKTNEQESAALLRCMRNVGLSISLQPAPAHA